MGIFESERAVYRLKGEVKWGEVDYDEHTMSGAPAQTKVNYLFLTGEGDAGVKYALGRSSVEPFWGLGYKWWRRDIEHSATGTGYLETWQSLYVKVGAHADYGGAGPVRPFGEAALRLSVYNKNRADFGFAVVSTEPGNTVTPYVEAGLQVWRLKGSVYYEGIDFPQSAEASADIGGTPFVFIQPKSRGHIYGAKLGASF